MLTATLPSDLQDRFEQMARLTFGEAGAHRALIEAVEEWLAARRNQMIDKERRENEQAFTLLRPELEKLPKGKWFVIAHGKLQAVVDDLTDVIGIAPNAYHRFVMQTKIDLEPEKTEFGWQIQ